ncbi:MAG: hypothetical protein MR274_09055 [Clostridium sp.]|nr:hypothetical protein [Clostridium sp.]MDY3827755.1 hypothetical protein [Clostridium sp.]
MIYRHPEKYIVKVGYIKFDEEMYRNVKFEFDENNIESEIDEEYIRNSINIS